MTDQTNFFRIAFARISCSSVAMVSLAMAVLTLSACSQSGSDADQSPPLITPVEYPFILNNALYAFDPETGESEPLARSDKALMLSLDTDQSIALTDENNMEYQAHSSLPEFVAYVVDEELWLFDLTTRESHLLSTKEQILEAHNANDEGPAEALPVAAYICDLQKAITVDLMSFENKVELLKDEKAVYIKTSENEDCTGASEDFTYSRIIIADSRKDTFTIRRNQLLRHRHASDHPHDADHGHAGNHELDDGDKHEHEHSHDIGNNHEHGHTHGTAEHEAEHRLAKNLETITETLPVLVGKLRRAEEALMYAGTPIVDTKNNQFGYLGFDTNSSIYKFFLADIDTLEGLELEKTELWRLTGNNFEIIPERELSNKPDKLFPAMTRTTNYPRLSDSLLIEHNWQIFQLKFENFFDDDQRDDRDFSVNNPVFSRTPETEPELVYSPAVLRYNEAADALFAVKDQNTIFTVDNDGIETRVREMNDVGLTSFEFELFSNHIVATKHYDDEQAITAINIATRQETTLLARTSDEIQTKLLSDGLYVSQKDSENSNWNAQIILNNTENYYASPLTPALWTTTYDSSTRAQIGKVASRYPSIITEPENVNGFEYYSFFFNVPEVTSSSGVFIHNNHYGYVKIKSSEDENAPEWVVYFDPSRASSLRFMYTEPPD